MYKSINELEVLLSLSRSSQNIQNINQAESTLRLLGFYLCSSFKQSYPYFSGVKDVEPSPWQVTTRLLTRAILTLGNNFPEKLGTEAETIVSRYLSLVVAKWQSPESFSNLSKFFPLLFSFQGFLEALAQQTSLTSYSTLRSILKKIEKLITTDFLLQLETTIARATANGESLNNNQTTNNNHINNNNNNNNVNSNSDEDTPQNGSATNYLKTHPNNGTSHRGKDEDELLPRWKYYILSYLQNEQQLGAMLLNYYVCNFARAIAAKVINFSDSNTITSFRHKDITLSLLNKLLRSERPPRLDEEKSGILDTVSQLAISQIHSLDEGADYIELASPERIELAYSTKASALDILGVSVHYRIIQPEFAVNIVKSSILHEHGMSNYRLALTVFKFASLLCSMDDEISNIMVRYLPHFIALPPISPILVRKCARALVYGLRSISQDVVVSTIYTLVNIVTVNRDTLPVPSNGGKNIPGTSRTSNIGTNPESNLNEKNGNVTDGEDEYTLQVYRNAISAIVAITSTYDDPQVSALAATVLNQKLNSTSIDLDREVAYGVAKLAAYVPDKEFLSILRSFQTLAIRSFQTNDKRLRSIVQIGLCRLSGSLTSEHPLYETYLSELLQSIVDRGDVQELEHHRPHVEISATANEIALYLAPLSRLLPKVPEEPYQTGDDRINSLFRNTWYNMVVHGFSQNSEWTQKYKSELEIIARSTPPLVSAGSSNKIESDLELNTVLQRGSSHHNVNNQKEIMDSVASSHLFDFKTLQYPKLMFLAASVLLEGLRVNTGDCSKILLYFGDPGIRSGDTKRYMRHISTDVLKAYINNVIQGNSFMSTSDQVATQLKEMLGLCCHRVQAIQDQAFENCNTLIQSIPSSLCNEISLFTLLDLLSLLWKSCLDAETHEYEPRTFFSAPKSGVRIELSDSYDQRRENLQRLHSKARQWVRIALAYTPYDVKNILTSYMTDMENYSPVDSVALGFTFALEMGGTVTSRDRELSVLDRSSSNSLSTDTSAGFLSQYIWRREFHASAATDIISKVTPNFYDQAAIRVRKSLLEILNKLKGTHRGHQRGPSVNGSVNGAQGVPHRPNFRDVRSLLFKASGYLAHPVEGKVIAKLCVQIPMRVFNETSIQFGISLWTWAINEQPQLKGIILSEVAQLWDWSVKERLGLFARHHDFVGPAYAKMEYAPTNKAEINHDSSLAARDFACHQKLIRFLSSSFQSVAFESKHYLKIFANLLLVGLKGLSHASLHPFARTGRFELIKFALEVLDVHARFGARISYVLKHLIISSALTWFAQPAQWPFGGNRLNLKADMELLTGIALVVKTMNVNMPIPKSSSGAGHASESGSGGIPNLPNIPGLPGMHHSSANVDRGLRTKRDILLIFMSDELTKMYAWSDPLQTGPQFKDSIGKRIYTDSVTTAHVNDAWSIDPTLAVYLVERAKSPELEARLQVLAANQPSKVAHVPEALQYFIKGTNNMNGKGGSKFQHYLTYWKPVSPVESINLFLPQYDGDSLLLQYAMRSLESHDVNVTFFYVPQLVQTLRFDAFGYVERFILETANISQLFAHQIIWNIYANLFEGEDAPVTGEDEINPTLHRVIDTMIANFSPEDREFYEREFSFFNKVTSISRSLLPLLRKTKAEKKVKIDEEIAKINVDVGVYLPSNPDGIVVDIDRKSGRPLQSHAKTPFMATFKIQREVRDISEEGEDHEVGGVTPGSKGKGGRFGSINGSSKAQPPQISRQQGSSDNDDEDGEATTTIQAWQSAIFKVGDDCRQDVMALQLISIFRSIFNSYGLDLYVFPYRVTATAPGNGVIDALPNSISRDMLGREAVNGLYEYFTTKFGGEDSIQFQQARNNFVKSLAGYSVISYLIQFKDRHNGNIMYDDKGHILHIDFGFCFDIVPGGVKFEAAPFKLTHEMVLVMGGSTSTQAYRWFEELAVKAFLACRPHAETIIQAVVPMLDSGLPCFKGESTIRRLRQRFALEKSEREAALHMRTLIKQSYESVFTKGYDEFQRITNGIPY